MGVKIVGGEGVLLSRCLDLVYSALHDGELL